MAISNLWEMAKADRYTADGREAIAKAREADVEDRTYQIGEISQKTGLQKTAEGWVKPKSGNSAGGAKKEVKAETSFGKVVQENGKWGVRTKMGSRSSFMPAESEADAMEALKNMTEGFESVGGNKDTFKKSKDTKTQEAYERQQKKIASEQNTNKENIRKELLELEKQRRNYKDDTAENYAGHKIRLKQAALLEQAGFNSRADFDKYLREKSPEDHAPRQLTGDCKIILKKP